MWTYFKLCQPIQRCVLGAGGILYASDSCCLGSLMKVVFNLVKCCRDQAFDICMDGIAIQWLMGSSGLDRPCLLVSIYRGHYVRKDGAASRELMWAQGGYTCPQVFFLAGIKAIYFHTWHSLMFVEGISARASQVWAPNPVANHRTVRHRGY